LVYHILQPTSWACIASFGDAATTIPDNRLHNSSVVCDLVVSALGNSSAFSALLLFHFFLM